MSERDKEESGGFKVVDKRRFTASGEARADAPPEPKVDVKPANPPKPAPRQDPRARDDKRGQGARDGQKSSVDFMSFVASLATNAMAALGMLPEAQARGMPVNHQLAREYIEIIAMLQERTTGNLSREEESGLSRLLNELRMQYVEATSGVAPARPGMPGMPQGMPGLPGQRPRR